ncbi:hypothetical protein Tco_1570499 [Tanacetum coccineum]
MHEACEDRMPFVRELNSVTGVAVTAKIVVFLTEIMNKEGFREWQLRDLEKEAKERALEIEMFIQKLMLDASEISEDLRLAREINALCARLTAIVNEREAFADELDILAGRSVPGKMAEFMKQVQVEDCGKRGLFVGFSFVVPPALLILIGSAAVVGLVGGVAVFQEEEDAFLGVADDVPSEISGVCKGIEMKLKDASFALSREKKVRGAIPEESLMCPLNLYLCI